LIGLEVGNVGLWPAKTFVWRRLTQAWRNGGQLVMLSMAKLMKTFGKVPINVSKLKSIDPVVGIHFFFHGGAPSARPCVAPYT